MSSGIVTRRPLVLQLQLIEEGQEEYAEFGHLPRRRFTDFCTCSISYIVDKEVFNVTIILDIIIVFGFYFTSHVSVSCKLLMVFIRQSEN